jgi:hypothetical protein
MEEEEEEEERVLYEPHNKYRLISYIILAENYL